jgi:hypothetical protein
VQAAVTSSVSTVYRDRHWRRHAVLLVLLL